MKDLFLKRVSFNRVFDSISFEKSENSEYCIIHYKKFSGEGVVIGSCVRYEGKVINKNGKTRGRSPVFFYRIAVGFNLVELVQKGNIKVKEEILFDEEQQELIRIVSETIVKNPINFNTISNCIPYIGKLEKHGIDVFTLLDKTFFHVR
jgi:hypothetical protein